MTATAELAGVMAADAPGAGLADAGMRARLTPAAVEGLLRLAEIWRLTNWEACDVRGGMSERTLFRLKKGERGGSLSQDELTRVSALIGIFKGLRLLFSEPLADGWVRLLNGGALFHGARPIDFMVAAAFRTGCRCASVSMRCAAACK